MLESVFIRIVGMAFITSLATISASAFLTSRGQAEPLLDTVGGFISALLWGVCAFGSTNIEVVRDSASTLHRSEPMLTYLFVAFAAGMIIVGLVGTTFMLNVFDVRARRVG